MATEPFLGPQPTTSILEVEEKTEETKVNPYDPPFLFGALGRTRTPRQRRKLLSHEFLSRLGGWPAYIICGHIILQAGAWGFFAALHSRRGIPLSYKSAVWTSENQQIVDWITTVIATILAFFTTSLFSSGILKCITLHLHGDGMSLAAFIASTKISAGSLILDRDSRRWRVGFMSIVIFILTGGVLTAGWKALITPYSIDVHAPLIGIEIDLSRPVPAQLQNNDRLDFCVQSGTSGPEFIVGQTESGYAAAKNYLGAPATFNLMDQTVNISTAGIMPLSSDPRNADAWFPNSSDFLPNFEWDADLPSGLSSWSSLTQQGFTADVFCEYWDPKDATVPPIFVGNTTVKDWNNSENLIDNIAFSELHSDCQVDDKVALTNWSRAYTVEGKPNYLLMIACPSKDNCKLIFNAHPEGPYQFVNTTVCTLTPKITTVEVTYTDAGVINTVTSRNATLADPGAPPTLAAVRTLYNGVFYSQSPVSNGVGDKLKSLIPVQGGNSDTKHRETMGLMEYYILGVTEYSASVFRACLWANQTYNETSPFNMNVPVEGVLHADTVGWLQASPVTLLELIPGLLIAIFTIYAIITTLAYNSVDPTNEPFDPSDPLHLMAASAAGYLHNVFTGTRTENLMAVKEANVFLRDIEGRGPGLIRSD